MIFADTSIWIDHLRRNNAQMEELLYHRKICGHLMLTGEMAMGSQTKRDSLLADLRKLPQLAVVKHKEVFDFISKHRLFGQGLSYIDAHFLAAVMDFGDCKLWTRDKALHVAARRLRLAFEPLH